MTINSDTSRLQTTAPGTLIIACLVLTLAGCATPKSSPTTDQVVAKALPQTTEIAASWADVVDQGAIKDGWLATFGDDKLLQIVDEALQNNRDLAVAKANLDVAAGLATQAGARLTPAVSVGGSAQATDRGGNTTNTSGAALNMQWELDIWGKLGAGVSAAQETFRASEADLESARQSLVAQTAKAWFLATEANLQKHLATESVAIYSRTLEIAKTRVDAGAGQPQDVFLAKSDLAAAQERLRQGDGALTQAVRSIEVILGRYPSAELEVPNEFVPVPPAIPTGIPSDLLERRQDLTAAERRVAAAFQRIEVAKTAKLPSFSLTGSAGGSSNELIDLIGASNNFFSLGANFFVPLDLGGELQAQVDIETAQQEAALANYGSIALRAFNEVETSLTNESLLMEREAFLASSVENNKNALDIANKQYEVGAVDFLSVLQMQARHLNSRISLIRMQNSRLAQRVDLHLALGGNFD